MTLALDNIWLLPAAIGVVGVYYFAMRDLAPNTGVMNTVTPNKVTKD